MATNPEDNGFIVVNNVRVLRLYLPPRPLLSPACCSKNSPTRLLFHLHAPTTFQASCGLTAWWKHYQHTTPHCCHCGVWWWISLQHVSQVMNFLFPFCPDDRGQAVPSAAAGWQEARAAGSGTNTPDFNRYVCVKNSRSDVLKEVKNYHLPLGSINQLSLSSLI